MENNRKRESLRKQRRRKRRLEIFRKVIVTLLIIGILVGTIYGIIINVFKIKSVTFSGNKWVDDTTLKSAIIKNEADNNTIVFWFKDKYSKKVQIPYVETYKTKIEWPNKIVINVYEKKIMGYIKTSEGNMYFDKDGIVVEQSQELLENVPQLSGIKFEKIVLHQKMAVPNPKILPAVTEMKQQLDKYNLSIEEISFDEDYNIKLKAGNIFINMGKAEYLTEKVFEYSQLADKLKGMSGTLHLENCNGQETNIHFNKEE